MIGAGMRNLLIALVVASGHFLAAPPASAQFRPETGSAWREGVSFSQTVPESGASSLNGTVYLLSGSSGTGFKRFFEAYDIVEDGWRPLTPMPVGRTQFSVASGKGQIVATGGRVAGTADISKGSWMFSLSKSHWTQIAEMPGRRYGHMSAIVGNFLYVFGGQGNSPERIFRYNMSFGEWSVLPVKIPEQLSQSAIAVSGQDIIIAGGMTAAGRASRRVHVFNVKSQNWRTLPPLPVPLIAPAMGVLSDGLHVVGGYSKESQITRDVHYLLPKRGGAWREMPPLPEARHHAGYAVADDHLLVMGGAVGSGFFAPFTATNTVYIFKP